MAFDVPWSFIDVSLVKAIITALLSSYCISLVGTAIYNLYFHPLAKYPGPAFRAAFYFPDALSNIKGKAYKDTKLLHDTYGSVVRLHPNALSYNTAQAWEDIYGLKSDRTELAKDPNFYIRGESIIANQSEHLRLRKLYMPAFTDSALLVQEPLLASYFDLLVSKLKEQINGSAHGRVDMMAYYNFTTYDIIGDLVLGESFGALEGGKYHAWIRNVFESFKALGVLRCAATYPVVGLVFRLLSYVLPTISAKRAANAAFVEARTDKRLNQKTDRKDAMSYASFIFLLYLCLTDMIYKILRRNDERGLTRDEMISNARLLLTAGSETTATLLSGATYYLLQNPSILQRVQAEVRTIFKSEEDITLRSVSTPSLLPYLEAVLQESLRCYPPIPAILPRVTGPEGAVINGDFVPGNVSVGVHQWSTYRDKANFASPDTFAPERWLADAPLEYRSDIKTALQPFSLGPRGCMGKSLAYYEMRSIMARVLWNFDMEFDEASQGWMEQKEYTLWDKPSLWVRLKHRGAAITL